MNRVPSWYHIGQATFMSHLIVLVRRFMVAVREDCQSVIRLRSLRTRSTWFFRAYCHRRGLIGIRLWNWVQMFLFQRTGTTATVTTSTTVHYKPLEICAFQENPTGANLYQHPSTGGYKPPLRVFSRRIRISHVLHETCEECDNGRIEILVDPSC